MAKTQFFKLIQKAMSLSDVISKPNMPPANEIADWIQNEEFLYTNRREFLKKTLAGSISFSAIPSFLNFPSRKSKMPQIAIVGSGIAGLHAAHILYKNDFGNSFKVFEGSGRVGGRIFTERLNSNDNTTELGGEFIDSTHTDMLNLIKEFGLKLYDTQTDNLISDLFLIDGKQYSMTDAIKAFQNIRTRIGKDSKARGKKLIKLDNTSMKEYIDSLECDLWFSKALIGAFTGECGLDAEEQSALNLIWILGKQSKGEFNIFGNSDERYKLQGGNQQICNTIADKFREQIYLGHTLVGIRSKGNGFNLVFEFNNKTVEVYADYVIMTIPFSVLRNVDGIHSLQNITKEKSKCIRELGYGTNGKYFLEFKNRTWRTLGYKGGLFGNAIQNGWDSFHMQANNEGRSIYTVYLGGENGKTIYKDGGIDYLLALNDAFTGIQSDFTGFSSQFNWSSNNFIKGSYSCIKIGQMTTIASHTNTSVGNLLFAGEHCSENFGGFMNGAAETGRIAAETIIKKEKSIK